MRLAVLVVCVCSAFSGGTPEPAAKKHGNVTWRDHKCKRLLRGVPFNAFHDDLGPRPQ